MCEVVVSGAGYTGPQLYDYAFNYIEPLLEGISGVASAAPDGGQMRQINVVVDPVKVQARNLTAADVAALNHLGATVVLLRFGRVTSFADRCLI